MSYFEQSNQNPERFALQYLTRDEAEMLVQALIALKEANYMDHEEFKDERQKLQTLYKKVNGTLVESRHASIQTPCWAKRQQLLTANQKQYEQASK